MGKSTGKPAGQPYPSPSPSPSPLLSPSPKKISKSQKALIYEIEKKWPKVWVWMQFQANKNVPFEDAIETLESYWKYRETIEDPWPYCNSVVEKLIAERAEDARLKKWEQLKREDAGFAEKLADLLKNIGRPV